MQSKAFVLLVATFMALPAALAVPATTKPRHLTCDGNLYCCSKGLQGNIGYYCGSGPITKENQCDMVIVCCVKGAGRELTPRGYTYRGCSMPGTSS